MLKLITAAVVALFLAAPAYAASKADVAAAGCTSHDQARKAHRSDHLKYRLIDGKKCWYSNMAMAKKASTRIVAKPAPAPKKVFTEPLHLETEEELSAFFEFFCGGPCPQLKGEHRQQWPKRIFDD